MSYEIRKVEIWTGTVEDRPGGLADKLSALGDAGASFEFVLARPGEPGTSLVFVSPVRGTKQTRAAEAVGFRKAVEIQALRIEGPDKPGLGARLARALGDAGVNMRGMSALAIAKKCVVLIALDQNQELAAARSAVQKALKGK